MSVEATRQTAPIELTHRDDAELSVTGQVAVSNQAMQQRAKKRADDIEADPPKELDVAAFDSGRADGLAGKEPQTSLNTSDDAYKSYLLGWKRGRDSAERTQTSSMPSPSSIANSSEGRGPAGPLPMPEFLGWAPSAASKSSTSAPADESGRLSYEGPRDQETDDPYLADKFTVYDEAKVQKIITTQVSKYLLDRGPDGKRPSPPFDVEAAFKELQRSRDDYPYDVNLACAEHYMYARYSAGLGTGNPLFMFVQATGYQLAKEVPGHVGDDPKNPRTPPDIEQWAWAMEGSFDGTADLL
jgi:hypothetical protein